MEQEALSEKQIKDLIEDKEFLEGLVKAESEAGVKEIFKSKGIEVSDEDIKALGKKMKESLEELKELPEEEIEKVVGGVGGRCSERLAALGAAAIATALILGGGLMTACGVYFAVDGVRDGVNLTKASIKRGSEKGWFSKL